MTENRRYSAIAREKFDWCVGLDAEVYRCYVESERVNDEPIVPHRALFYGELLPRVAGLTLVAAILEVNAWCHEHATYRWNDDPTADPLTVYRRGYGRCGEESVFLVSALRSVGIASRQVYAERWSHCDDNHAWVEALVGKEWHFLGACEPEPVLNRGWFFGAAGRAMLVHSRAEGDGAHPLHGDFLEQRGGWRYYNQTARYAPVREYVFSVHRGGKPVSEAVVEVQILNEARFYTVLTLVTDGAGTARVTLGLGDVHLLCHKGCLWGSALCRGRERGDWLVELGEPAEGGVEEFTFFAPEAAPLPPPLTAPQKAERERILVRGNARRALWVSPPVAAELSADGAPLRYGENWTAAVWGADGWDTLAAAPVALTPGRYRTVTSRRLPSGDQLVRMEEVTVGAEALAVLPCRLRACTREELCYHRALPEVTGFTPDGGPALLCWTAGGEPSEHLRHELAQCGERLAALPLAVREFPTGVEGEDVARCLGLDAECPPLCVLTGGDGYAVYGTCGYRVGSVALMLDLAQELTERRR